MSSSVKTRLPGDKAKGPEDNIPKRFEEQDRHFSLVRNFYVADVITIMNGVCGVMSVFSSMRYLLSMNLSDLYLAMMFIPFGLLFDFLDGRVARWRKNSSLLGQELDSLADLVRAEQESRKVGVGGRKTWVY
ncbi:hypothetical protein BX666DRAFT_1951398 [Dichotomocladium elegans]|nr:hypothetical protein BX666DRAFT_1951398 [Dichotomocladium elegans]